jgi:hypothetical protein
MLPPRRGVGISAFDNRFLVDTGMAKLLLTFLAPAASMVEPAIESLRRLLFTKGTPILVRFLIKSFYGRALVLTGFKTFFYLLACIKNYSAGCYKGMGTNEESYMV